MVIEQQTSRVGFLVFISMWQLMLVGCIGADIMVVCGCSSDYWVAPCLKAECSVGVGVALQLAI
jgi:hypothetical protein